MNVCDPKQECMPRDDIRQWQLERLQSTLNRVYKNVAHYRKQFREMDFMPEDLNSVDDLSRLPLLTRRDLMDKYPYDMFAVPLREIVRLHAPALHQDEPVVMGFTRVDLDNWAELIARNLTAAGLDKDDVIQVSSCFGVMTGSFGVQAGARRIGASVIPMPDGILSANVKIMRDFRTTALVSTPGFALGLLAAMEEMDINPRSLHLKTGIIGSGPWSEAERRRLEDGWRITAADSYSLAEIFGPGVAWECPAKAGLHIPEDHFIPEIIDPETGALLPEGQTGELVLTTITKEAFPLIRFRTGDLTSLTHDPCECGRSHCRIRRISGRCDGAVAVRGMRITPDRISRVLRRETRSGTAPAFQIIVARDMNLDHLTVLVEITEAMFFDEMRRQRRLVEHLRKAVSDDLGWEVNLKLLDPGMFDAKTLIRDTRSLA